MLADSHAYSGFAVDDLDRARRFYEETLGLPVTLVTEMPSLMRLRLGSGADVLVYAKDDYVPATYTVLNFPVRDLEATVDALTERGVKFERYAQFNPDEKGIHHAEGPPIAWFTDSAGNILSLIQD